MEAKLVGAAAGVRGCGTSAGYLQQLNRGTTVNDESRIRELDTLIVLTFLTGDCLK